ncbi:MAG TPA: hypothetical protein VHS09_08495 [Polyangiaceae bacterium]|nr:hypothetical protein [Polyangiaceae bacterium]
MREPVARAIYGAAVAGLGVLLLSGAFVAVWAPVPQWVPGRQALALVTGTLMLLSSVGLAWSKTIVRSSAVLTFLFVAWLLVLQVPRLVGAPTREGLWAGAAQIVTTFAAGWIVFASLAPPVEGRGRWLRGVRAVRVARVMFAVALPMFGLHHFVDIAGAADAVPVWLPFRLGWAYLTGVGHVAAGAAILLGVAARLAATLEATMITAFVLLVHVPGVIDAPADRLQWTMLVVASVIGGAAWIVAASYSGHAAPAAHAEGADRGA